MSVYCISIEVLLAFSSSGWDVRESYNLALEPPQESNKILPD